VSPTEDYLVGEPLLVERLKASLPELRYVLTADTLESAKDWTKATPVAHVIYMGDEVPQGAAAQGGGPAQLTHQLWMVVLVVKHAGTVTTGEGARRKAGPLIAKMLKALTGWAPGQGLTALRRAPGAKPGYRDGYGYYPFTFRTSHLVLGKT